MDKRPIGIFDSGLGGLSVVKEFIRILPCENIVYFGDTGRVPYGTKSRDTILRYARQDEQFLLENDVKMVIAACGTVSSVAYDTGKDLSVPFLGVVEPSARAAVSLTKNKKVGVIGTPTTVSSNSYKKAINAIDDEIEVYQQGCPLFVSIVEQGWIDENDEIAFLTAKRYLNPLKEAGVDTLILGCTHFPLIAPTIARVMGKNVKLISSGSATAAEAAQVLKENNMLNENNDKPSRKYFVSDSPVSFSKTAQIFLNSEIKEPVEQIQIEKYGKE
ncbi:MAG: glutamate racemase [Acutalibacteraceae bacterium]